MPATTTQLSSRERVRRMFERKDHDRVPRFDQFWPETVERWQREGFDGSLLHTKFDFDLFLTWWLAPQPLGIGDAVISEDQHTRVTRNAWGATLRQWKGRFGTPEHIAFDCVTPEVWRRKYKPGLVDAAAHHLPAKEVLAAQRQAREQGRFVCVCGFLTYEMLKSMLGDEVMLMAMASEPEWIIDLSRTYTDLMIAMLERAAAAGVEADALWVFEDLAYSGGPLCSPAMYRELIWPDHRRVCEWAHRHGMKFIFHTDGNVNRYMDLFVEAGFDCLQPLEAKAGMDVRTLAPRYGDKLALFGNIDARAMISNDPQVIEHELRSKLAAGMATKGYLYHSDHSVGPQVSWASYQWLMKLLDEHGRYDHANTPGVAPWK